MWLQVVYLLEVFATLACIHSIYGEKLRWNVKPIVFCMSLMVILEVANISQNGRVYSWLVYIPIIIYCKCVFGNSIIKILGKVIWLIIFLTATEFICLLISMCFDFKDVIIRNVFINLGVLLISIFVLPCLHVKKVRLRGVLAKLFWVTTALVMFILILQGKYADKINATPFVILIPVLLVLLYIFVKFSTSQEEVDIMKREFEITKKMDEKYAELVDDIRIKQHGYKNHITAILSAHYTYHTYERLVQVQDEYCKRLVKENKYTNLLQIENKVLAGFLYEKFLEIEKEGIEVEYKIGAAIDNYSISTYHLIEILGILLDNALESVKNAEDKFITFKVSASKDKYLLSVFNISKYISYDEIENWFQKGISSKGKNRGLGLYHVKCLCQELNCDIYCRNVEYNEDNWIEFCLEICKADSE